MKHIAFLLISFCPTQVWADPPQIGNVITQASSAGWTFSVTIRHADTGWDHYADSWRVELLDGTVLGTRELLHPHEHEQPFTRSLANIEVPLGTLTVYIRSRCNVDGWSETVKEVQLPQKE
ncbi:hypothetical protein [Shimia sp.]|uniref:hypothetical protein n=1 Tax=Shimia sp. TaxID=1954381 RepID=UPI003BA849B6